MKNLYKLIFYEETHISGKDEQEAFDKAIKIAPRRLYMKHKIELIRNDIK